MSGSCGDGGGTVYLAHAWCPDEHRAVTVGPWHWWNVYKDANTAAMQALRRSKGWGEHGSFEVLAITHAGVGGNWDPYEAGYSEGYGDAMAGEDR